MKNNFIFLIGIVIKNILLLFENPDAIHFPQMLRGINFQCTAYQVALQFFEFMLYSYFFYGEVSRYITNGGLYTLIRERSRKRMVIRIMGELGQKLLFLKLFDLLSYYCFCFIIQECKFSVLLTQVCFSFVRNYIVFYVLMSIQIWLELWFDSQVSILVSGIYFIVTIMIGNYMYLCSFPYWGYGFLFVNLAFDARYDHIDHGVYLLYCVIFISIMINYILLQKMKKKDFI